MQVRCVKAHGYAKPGDLAEVPDGAAVSPEFWEPAPPAELKTAADTAPAETTKAGA